MKLPTFDQARDAIEALAKLTPAGASIAAAADLVQIVADLFTDLPDQREALQEKYREARRATDAAFDRLDDAIAEARRPG